MTTSSPVTPATSARSLVRPRFELVSADICEPLPPVGALDAVCTFGLVSGEPSVSRDRV